MREDKDIATRAGGRVAGSGGVLKVTAVEMQVRRSGRTMVCAGKPFDGMPLKMHKCTWCLSHRLACWAAMGNRDSEHPVVGCLVLHVVLVGARARGWPAGAV